MKKFLKKDIKKVIPFLIILSMVACAVIPVINEVIKSVKLSTPLKSMKSIVTIDSTRVYFDDYMGFPLLTETNRTLVPIRIISEKMGYDVDWSEDTWHQGIKKVWISDDENNIELEIGKTTALVNGVEKPIDVQDGKPVNTKSVLENSRTYVPLRFITEALGGKIDYEMSEDGTHLIDISTGKEIEEGWIEPELEIVQMPYRTAKTYFYIVLHNYKDYEEIGNNLSITSILQGYEHLRKYRSHDMLEPGFIVYNDDNRYKNFNYDEVWRRDGLIYKLTRLSVRYNLHNDDNVTPPNEGDIMTVKVTVKIGNKSKDYYLKTPFEHKSFALDDPLTEDELRQIGEL